MNRYNRFAGMPTALIGTAKLIASAVVLLGMSGAAQAALIRVTVTGSITQIFNIAAAPFAIGDAFRYELIVDDDPLLDSAPGPDDTLHLYNPGFQEGVAGSASLSFGAYSIAESSVEQTLLTVRNDSGASDKIEILTSTAGAPLIDGLAPVGFSLKREDFSQTALTDAILSPELFMRGGFSDVDAVFLSVTGGGSCVNRKCAYGEVNSITATRVFEPSSWLLLGVGFGMMGLVRRRTAMRRRRYQQPPSSVATAPE